LDWLWVLLLMFGCLFAVMATGIPIAFAMLFTCMVGAALYWGGVASFSQLAMSFYNAVTSFVFLPIPMFILMGTVLFETGMGSMVVEAVDKLMGRRLPARLSLVAVWAGALLGAMIGISGGSISILGRTLLPEMLKRGYRSDLSLGPIVASGTLAIMIPPSALAVLVGAMSGVSVSQLLVSIILPGLLLAGVFSVYLIWQGKLHPPKDYLAAESVPDIPLREKLRTLVTQVLPLTLIIFAVIGTIFMGVATPSEAAALGALACFVLAVAYRRLTLTAMKNALFGAAQITIMVLLIVVGSISFSRILASSGALRELTLWAASLQVPSMFIVLATLGVVLILGCFMDPSSIVMVTVPLVFPLMAALDIDHLWYATVYLLMVQIGLITPPFGLDCYTAKAVAPEGVTLEQVFRAAMPFLVVALIVAALILVFPPVALWLPAMVGH